MASASGAARAHAYPRTQADEPKRPFRLWDATKKQAVRWRYYSTAPKAHNSALIEARWAKVGHTIEVFDARTGRMLGQYTRTLRTVLFLR